MKIEKTFTVLAPIEQVWQFITSPEQVAPCIPGCEGAEETGSGKYKAVIKTKVGPIKTTFKVDIERLEERPPEFASYETRGEEGSKASRIKAGSTLALKSINSSETEVTYTSDINLMGRLGKFGSGMMQKVADGIGNEFVTALKEKVEEKNAEDAVSAVQAEDEQAASHTALYWGIGLAAIAILILVFLL